MVILSYFAATQAETIGLQLRPESPYLATVPGLHLIEVVDEEGRWVDEGEEGERRDARSCLRTSPRQSPAGLGSPPGICG